MRKLGEFLFGVVALVPMLCVVAGWMLGDWLAGRKIGAMDDVGSDA